MIDNSLPIPDAESLPLYRMVLKLVCVCACVSGYMIFHLISLSLSLFLSLSLSLTLSHLVEVGPDRQGPVVPRLEPRLPNLATGQNSVNRNWSKLVKTGQTPAECLQQGPRREGWKQCPGADPKITVQIMVK